MSLSRDLGFFLLTDSLPLLEVKALCLMLSVQYIYSKQTLWRYNKNGCAFQRRFPSLKVDDKCVFYVTLSII